MSLRRQLVWLLPCFPLTFASCLAASEPVPMSEMNVIAGHFRLTTPEGEIVDSDELAGKPYVLFFGFTSCPNLCPTTLGDLSGAIARLPPAAKDLRVYFVTIDPEHDNRMVLGQYISSFDRRIIGLTGARADIDEALRSFGAVAHRDDLGNGRYTYSHTASVFLIDGNGLIVDRIGADLAPNVIADRLVLLTGVSSPPVR